MLTKMGPRKVPAPVPSRETKMPTKKIRIGIKIKRGHVYLKSEFFKINVRRYSG